MLQSHGAVCLGETMDEAFKVAKVLEITAQMYLMVRATGKMPVPISENNIRVMQEFMKNEYSKTNRD